MSSQRPYGATPEAWDHFAETLGLLEDLLPVVSNPHAEVSDHSAMKQLGKTPSIYNREHKVAGIPKWTQLRATEHLIQRWRSDPDLGICIQTRKVRGIDQDHPRAAEIADAIDKLLGMRLPRRVRGERLLQAFTYNRPLTKRVVPVADGIIEILADGQQFIAESSHIDSKRGYVGERYVWEGGLPATIPVLTGEQLEQVWGLLTTMYATGEPRIARERRAGTASDIPVHDDVADWLVENWETYDVGRDGQVFIACPFADEHTADSGPSATAYFPAGTGGYSRGHFVCLHAHCAGREDHDYLDATGYNLAQFADLGAVSPLSGHSNGAGVAGRGGGDDRVAGVARSPEPIRDPAADAASWPPMVRDKAGKIEPTADNLFRAIVDGGMIYRRIAYDNFTDNLVWASIYEPRGEENWQRFTDADLLDVRVEMERRGSKPMSKDLLRDTVHAAGKANAVDTAIRWLTGLSWDGVPRIHRFAVECWGWEDDAYAEAVGSYVWTALAGRVLQPGVRADMAPILVGAQGIKKTTAIQAMAPHEDMYAEIKLDERDDDLSRKLRGKLVGELEELRGLNSRDLEEIKAFVSRRRESWVPKYKEFENFFWRRSILIGSTNETGFLADPTGERRWLPGESKFIDIDKIIENRDQLWAEGAQQFLLEGVAWREAERLAQIKHPRYKVADAWERAIALWIEGGETLGGSPLEKGHVTAGEIMTGALGITISQQNRTHEARVTRAMKHLGFRHSDVTENGYSYKVFTK